MEGERTSRALWAKADGLTPDNVIKNARDAAVTSLICVGCDLEDSRLAVRFVQKYETCHASIGIHPHEAQHFVNKPDLLEEFAQLSGEPKVVAVGECGLDYFYGHSPQADQEKILRFQIELALQHKLPLIFHVREAFDDFWPIFDQYSGIRGVLHSFTDSAQNMQRAVERGLRIGVNGIATFTKHAEQLEMYTRIPLQNLLLETDAPFLTPAPYRGTICEPKHVRTNAEFLSKLRGESLDALAAATSDNARNLFGI
jgi:TatD DNase family protein